MGSVTYGRLGFRAIGNFTRCATFVWHIEKRICAMWEDVEFPPKMEAAFQALKTLLYYHPA